MVFGTNEIWIFKYNYKSLNYRGAYLTQIYGIPQTKGFLARLYTVLDIPQTDYAKYSETTLSSIKSTAIHSIF